VFKRIAVTLHNLIAKLLNEDGLAVRVRHAIESRRHGEAKGGGLKLAALSTVLRVEWMAREIHPWEQNSWQDQKDRLFTEQCLEDTLAVIERLFKESGIAGEAIDHFCMAATISGAAAAVAKRLKIKPEAVIDNLAARCGDTGAAHPLIMLAVALEKAAPGEKILLIGFGAGCDALLLETTDAIRDYKSGSSASAALARSVTEKSYTKLLSFSDELDLDWGMRSETDAKTALTQLYRAQDQVIGFVGGQCGECSAIQFPRLAACVNCGSIEPLTPYPLADQLAKVATFTADWLMFYPAPPLYVGLVQFDNGARVLMEMVDVDPAQFDVGSPLRMVFRIKEKDSRRHYNRYFWKAVPAV